MATKKSKKSVEQSLLAQLQSIGATADHYVDLVGDYLRWWTIHQDYLRDVKTRGIIVPRAMSTGIITPEPNPSVKAAREASQHMLAILRELGLSPGHGADLGGEVPDL